MSQEVKRGFTVKITVHTFEAWDWLDPQKIRDAIGKALDNHMTQEEVDYTLEVGRFYE
jgi:hypothetical protein